MSGHPMRTVPVIAGVLALALSSVASADPPGAPFVLVLQGNANPTPTSDPCILTNTETGTGQSAALGAFTWESSEVVDLCANGNADIDGHFTLTAANGDKLSGTYRTSAHLDFQAGVITAVGRYKLTGGTGGFAGARGKGVTAATGSLAPPFAFDGGLFGSIVQ